MGSLPRLRQVVLAAEHLAPVAEALQRELGLEPGYNDPGVGEFGLENVVFAAGDTFIEVVSPTREDTTAGRLLQRDGDGGYMAIFQTDDLAAARKRVDAASVRVVWEISLEDIAAMHLHPKDMPGAIVSIDRTTVLDAWRWAGPEWTGEDITAGPGGVRKMTVRVDDPAATALRWSQIIGTPMEQTAESATIALADGRQVISFEPGDGRRPGISSIALERPGALPRSVDIGGLRIDIVDA